MKSILRGIVTYSLSLYLTQFILPGLKISGGLQSILMGGILLALGYMFIKPVLSVISMPITMLTFGFFSWVIITIIFYGITKINSDIAVVPFKTYAFSIMQFQVKSVSLSEILSYVAISVTIYILARGFQWVFTD